ncbi:hypothetical protein ACQKWADRAFT_32076 [Trichoderma austrokoningii]
MLNIRQRPGVAWNLLLLLPNGVAHIHQCPAISTRQPNKLLQAAASEPSPTIPRCPSPGSSRPPITPLLSVSTLQTRTDGIRRAKHPEKKTLHKTRAAHKISESSLPGSSCHRDIVEPGVASVTAAVFSRLSVPRNLLSPGSAFGCRLYSSKHDISDRVTHPFYLFLASP